MALAKPDLVKPYHRLLLHRIQTPNQALDINRFQRIEIFNSIKNRIRLDDRLQNASEAGEQIMERFGALS